MPNLGTTEILLILAVVILLFGAKKLPELARGSGRALRIFKAETKGLHDDDKAERDALEPGDSTRSPLVDPDKRPVVDADKRHVVDPDKHEA